MMRKAIWKEHSQVEWKVELINKEIVIIKHEQEQSSKLVIINKDHRQVTPNIDVQE